MRLGKRVTELLGIDYPIVQGGMAWVAEAELAAAVSNGGGLGIVAAASMPPELLDKELKKVRALTDRPFGVNIMLMSPTASDAIEVAAANRVPVATTGAGSPGKVLERLKPLGTKVVPVVPTTALARRVERQGADAVIVEGCEAGGHIGELTTMVATPLVVDAVDIPVIAAGGIADGRGMAAAFALGAEGVQIGTRFVCSSECRVHENYKLAILNAKDRSSAVTGRPTGHPVRCIRNKLTSQFDHMEISGASVEDIEALGAGKLRAAVVDGDVDFGSVMAGQIAAMVSRIQPASEIIEEICREAEEVLSRLGSLK
ncbi:MULTISPECIES: enoyl-[acyl-carrier-protein] reductase FabK [Dethiosulfovibrio]|jgi:enoyl-[acyl-carrier protein] reductase II|uniref:Enoyl-[acyl-carrier-protein] reductase FabK n=2 Tax=Dethiosulfovibrio TaxID=47054 RepID=A0ABS9EPZ8_9BACT|nr:MULTISPECIES: enoyl-[acyl-carrier-protein] reductase FabK [Dethiosulfovibrio]MCF4113495.1 enoyl-[acyl-carrier-protein] reductase FabK [Dethiosulfovibrio russensis]MCF4141965.1 enoyl-[acyl-carrier-protein] reductase FabK [Dethiosulfovibrio marinus]MCF4144120.1 enoyl-[acyl-carrier-protein] reductase FabK [Dethiosulfovibrio acidaminovorans]